jgi:putative heme transporter
VSFDPYRWESSRPMHRLSQLGRTGWSITGAVLGACALLAAVAFLLPLLMPLLVTLVAAATLQPLVDRLRHKGVPPTVAALIGALFLPLALIALALLLARMVVAQAPHWADVVEEAGAQLRSVTGADPLAAGLTSGQWRTAILGVGSLLTTTTVALAQLAIGVLAAAYLLFFLFRDGPRFAGWLERRVPLRPGLFRVLVASATLQLRNYVIGTTVVATLDAIVITLGAIALGLPLLAAIAIVTFVAAFVPYVGAWLSAIFAVVVALGAGGVSTALWMLAIVLVTQNILEGLLRPYVFGRALGLHPIVVLGATVLGAALAGLAGVFIAPPAAAIIASWWSHARGDAPAAEEWSADEHEQS